jgi:hypothetical protein
VERPDRLGRDEPEESLSFEDVRAFCEEMLAEARRYTREKPLRGLAGAFLLGALIGLLFRGNR